MTIFKIKIALCVPSSVSKQTKQNLLQSSESINSLIRPQRQPKPFFLLQFLQNLENSNCHRKKLSPKCSIFLGRETQKEGNYLQEIEVREEEKPSGAVQCSFYRGSTGTHRHRGRFSNPSRCRNTFARSCSPELSCITFDTFNILYVVVQSLSSAQLFATP